MRGYVIAGTLLIVLGMACEEKKKSQRAPVRSPEQGVVLANPVEITLPSVAAETPAADSAQEPERPAPVKPMAMAAKVLPPPAPIHYEDVTGRILAEGSRNEAKDQSLAKIREKAKQRLKKMQDVEEPQKDPTPDEVGAKVAMVEPEGAHGAENGVEAAKIEIDEPIIKNSNLDPKTAKNLDLQFRKARVLAKAGKVEEAKGIFLTVCQAGHAHACHKFAWYEEQAGNTLNATRFYRAACDNGLGKSCNNLAFQFERIKIYDKALDLYAIGCKQKHEASCTSLKRLREEQHGELKAR